MEIELKNNIVIVTVEKDIYNSDVLHKCFYWYSAHFNIDINSKSDIFFQINLEPKSINDTFNFSELSERIKRDILDFKLRDIVTKETQNIRELLVAKAFAHFESDDNPTTEISDPLGFDPGTLK